MPLGLVYTLVLYTIKCKLPYAYSQEGCRGLKGQLLFGRGGVKSFQSDFGKDWIYVK